MIQRNRLRTLPVLAAALALLQLAGCTCPGRVFPPRYFPDEEAAREHFATNRELFEEIAFEWITEHPEGIFVYFRDDDYRWGDAIIRKEGSSYLVTDQMTDTDSSHETLDEAAIAAQANPVELRKWIRIAREAKIYSITSWPWGDPNAPRHVEITLWGSESEGYGFRYVPPENEEYAAKLFEMIRSGSFSLDTGTVSHIEGSWFYFEGLR